MGSRWFLIVCLAAAVESPAGEPDWDRWIRDLESEDLATRERAAGAILEEGIRDPESAAARLSSAPVVDPEAVFRCRQIAQSLPFEAARRDVLGRAGDDPGLRLLLDDYLADPSPRALWLIENVWGETHPDALPAAVGALLRSPWPKTRARGVAAAAKLEEASLVPVLAPLLETEAEELRSRILEALGATKSPSALPAIEPFLESGSDLTRYYALKAYTEIRGKEALPFLVSLVREGKANLQMRAEAGWRLAEWRDPAGLPALVALLTDTHPYTQDLATYELSKFGRPAAEAVRPLLAAVRDDVRRRAAVVIGDVGNPAFCGDILSLLGDPFAGARRAALVALGKLGNPEAVPDVRALLGHEDAPFRGEAARTLGLLGDRESLPRIRGMLDDEEWTARLGAAEALVALGETGPVKALIIDPRAEVRQLALELLAEQGDRAAMERIAACLDDPDVMLRKQAMRTVLRFLGDPPLPDAGGDMDRMARRVRVLLDETREAR